MIQGQQQQQQQQPQVVVVQQPIILGGQQRKTLPYFLRGYRFSSGRKLPGMCFILMPSIGIVLLSSGLRDLIMGWTGSLFVGFCLFVLGALLFGPGIYFCCKARQQFNELPQDHPHRYKYGSGYVLPVIQTAVPANNTDTTYNFTPGTQGPAGGSASFQGYPTVGAPYLQGPPGANTSYPQGSPASKGSFQMPPAPIPYYHGHPERHPGQTGPSQAYPPPSPSAPYSGQSRDTYPSAANDDLPPSYSDIEANKCQ